METIEQYEARQAEIRSRLKEIDHDHVGVALPEALRSEWASLNDELEANAAIVTELRARKERLAELSGDPARTESQDLGFHTRRSGTVVGDDIYDLSTLRSGLGDPKGGAAEMRDRALRSLEAVRHMPAAAKDRIDALLERDGSDAYDAVPGYDRAFLARRMLITGSPDYKRAFSKSLAGRPLSGEEQRALSLGTGSAGGFAVVYELDPTIVPTSNFSVNPFRAVARQETLTGTNEWKAVTSGAISASYAAEATQVADNSPTLAQPDIIVEKAQTFVQYSIELGQDWGALVTEMAGLLQDAKDDLEATKFATGAGHGSFEPKGIITGATATTAANGVATFAIADIYKVFEALPARFRPRAQWMGNLFTIDKIRQFDTSGGSGVWMGVGSDGRGGLYPAIDSQASGTLGVGNAAGVLLQRPFWESTAMAAALTTGSKILIVGDWRHFVIVDRVGMDIELVPQIFGANQRPTGQRGLYAYWRNSSDVLTASAFQVLVTG